MKLTILEKAHENQTSKNQPLTSQEDGRTLKFLKSLTSKSGSRGC